MILLAGVAVRLNGVCKTFFLIYLQAFNINQGLCFV